MICGSKIWFETITINRFVQYMCVCINNANIKINIKFLLWRLTIKIHTKWINQLNNTKFTLLTMTMTVTKTSEFHQVHIWKTYACKYILIVLWQTYWLVGWLVGLSACLIVCWFRCQHRIHVVIVTYHFVTTAQQSWTLLPNTSVAYETRLQYIPQKRVRTTRVVALHICEYSSTDNHTNWRNSSAAGIVIDMQ